MNNKEKFLTLVSGEDKELLKDIQWRRENREWLKKSRAISFKILETLREKGMSQKELANKIGVKPQQVNKWVKGKENFQLDTITKIERALNIKLILINEDVQENDAGTDYVSAFKSYSTFLKQKNLIQQDLKKPEPKYKTKTFLYVIEDASFITCAEKQEYYG